MVIGNYLFISSIIIIILYLWLLSTTLSFHYVKFLKEAGRNTLVKINNFVIENEKKTQDNLITGKISGIKKAFLFFLNDLTIDLGLKRSNVPITEFMFFIIVGVLIISLTGGQIIFHNILIGGLFAPFIVVLIFCLLFTKTSTARYNRLMDVLMAENILSNSIQMGIVRSVEVNIDSIPISLKQQFLTFLSDVKERNYETERALNMLGMDLGHVSNEFIQKCVVLEKLSPPGYAKTFLDLISTNNAKIRDKADLDRVFQEKNFEFVSSVVLIFIVIIGSVIVIEPLRNFYFRNVLGSVCILMDVILIVSLYLFLTILKGREI